MARGRVVADGPATQIKAMVGGRTVRFTLPGADHGAVETLPGVTSAQVHGDGVALTCADSDAALRAAVATFPAARDFEITGARLEDAFVELTRDHEEVAP